jgi:hypothetical protein
MDKLQKIIDVVGLGWPLTYSMAIYGLFWFLDSQASQRSNDAVNNWLGGRTYKASDAKFVAQFAFDTIYSQRLLSIRAFIRSAIISLTVTILVTYILYPMTFEFMRCEECGVSLQFSLQILTNILADYIALLVIMKLLKSSLEPHVALFLAPPIGLAAVIAMYTAVDVVRFSFQTNSFAPVYFAQGAGWWIDRLLSGTISSKLAILAGAIAVYFWLPAMAVSALFLRTLNILRQQIRFAQPYIAQGSENPLRILGLAVGSFTFVLGLILQVLIGLH